jgi:hypothetical protein
MPVPFSVRHGLWHSGSDSQDRTGTEEPRFMLRRGEHAEELSETTLDPASELPV